MMARKPTEAPPDPTESVLAAIAALNQEERAQVASGRTPPPSRAMVDLISDALNRGVTWQRIADTLGRKQPNVVASFRPFLVIETTVRPRTEDDE